MKERVFLSNNQDGIIENYWMMHFLNVTDVLTKRVNCSGSTFNLTLFWRVVRDLHALLKETYQVHSSMCEADAKIYMYLQSDTIWSFFHWKTILENHLNKILFSINSQGFEPLNSLSYRHIFQTTDLCYRWF